MRLGLGTVQFGTAYGISNRRGRPESQRAWQILDVARRCGIRVLDTAPSYGDAETVLGQYPPGLGEFFVVSKTPVIERSDIGDREVEQLGWTFQRSLLNLQRDSIHGLLVHDVENLFAPGGARIVQFLESQRSQGRVEKIGVSIYSGTQADRVLNLFVPDIVQLPLSPFDQRLLASGHLARMKGAGVELHARSIFLQGLLLMDPNRTPPYFSSLQSQLRRYRAFLAQNDLSPIEASLGFARQTGEIDTLLVGVTGEEELEQIHAMSESTRAASLDYSPFAVHDERWVDPRQWKL